MLKAKKGDIFSCEVCGLIVAVDEIGLGMAEISCCKMDMAKGKAAADKARKKNLLAAAKTPAKAVKPLAAKAPAPIKSAAKAAARSKAAPIKAAPVKAAPVKAASVKAAPVKAVPAKKPAAKTTVKAKK